MCCGVAYYISQCDCILFFECTERFGRRVILAFAVRYGDGKFFHSFEPWAFAGDFEIHPATYISPAVVRDKRTRQNASACDYLKPVAYPERERVTVKELLEVFAQVLFEPIAVCFAGARVIAIRESARKYHYLRVRKYCGVRNKVIDMHNVGSGTDGFERGFGFVLGVESVSGENYDKGFRHSITNA